MAGRLGAARQRPHRPGHRARPFAAALLLCRFPEHRPRGRRDLRRRDRPGRAIRRVSNCAVTDLVTADGEVAGAVALDICRAARR